MNKLYKFLILILPFVVVFIASLYQPADSDLGWHLKYGEYFFQHGQILRDNIFSTEMPDYKWANSSWLTDLITYFTFDHFGFMGLSVLAAVVVSLTFFFFAKASRLDYFEMSLIFPYLLIFVYPVTSVSFRGQLLSLMLTGILFLILKIFEETKSKIIFLTIPLFIAWVNLHGQFLIGLGLFYLWSFIFVLQNIFVTKERKQDNLKVIKMLGIVVIFSALATLVNPFGSGIYTEIVAHANSQDLKSIVEYLPFNELTTQWWNQVFMGFMLFFGLIFFIFGGVIKQNLSWTSTALVLFPLSFWVRRYSWTMYYLTMPLLKPLAAFFKPKDEKTANRAATIIFIATLGFIFWLSNPIPRISNMTWETYCKQYIGCPDNAIKNIQENKYSGQLMTTYNWGGYMIWRYPNLKPSIDGRMHLWKDDSGYSAFSYYYPLEQNIQDIDKSKFDVVLMSTEKPVAGRLARLANQGKWKLVYFDEDSVVFIRQKN